VVVVCCDGPFKIAGDSGATIASEPAQQPVDLCIVQSAGSAAMPATSIVQADQEESTPIELPGLVRLHLTAASSASIFTVSRLDGAAHGYRGSISVAPLPNHTLRIVNDLDLEDYLLGVVKAEIGADAPIEAMKAQAVAARTYAVRNIGRLWQEDADLDDTTRSQGYLGRDGETAQVSRAVNDTSGQVLVFGGTVIDAMYSTDCGGMTAPGPPDEPYLRSIKEPLCACRAAWTVTVTEAQLEALLGQSEATVIQHIENVTVATKDSSGRADEIGLQSKGGFSETVSAVKLRQLIGVNVLRSTLFTIKKSSDGVWEFHGSGWGHGMGMCQAGAIARASQAKPEAYSQILGDYYPGAQLVPLTGDMVPEPRPNQASTMPGAPQAAYPVRGDRALVGPQAGRG